jgi:hypothetical protein
MMDKHPPFRVIAVDLDGTLLSTELLVSEENRRAIQLAYRQGLQIVLVSARPPFGIQMILEDLELDGCLVAYNGAYVIDAHRGEVLVDQAIAKENTLKAIQIIREHELYVGYYAGFEWYVEKECAEMHWERRALKRFPHVVDLTQPSLPEPHKLIVIDLEDNQRLLRVYRTMQGDLPDLNIHFSGQHAFEVTHQMATKGRALAFLAQKMNVPPESFAAIGDNYNDLEMFSFAGVSIAMGNSPSEVQSAADRVVASNDEHGVSQAIRWLLAKGGEA